MRLTNEHISSFQALYQKRFGKTLTPAEAREKATKLLRLMQLVYRPMTEAEFKIIQNRSKEIRLDLTL